jgi:hypothetical protein
VYLPEDVFGLWMSRPEPEVRSAGLFLSVYSTAITRHMTGGTFASLQRNLIHLHTDTDANFRREVHGYTQKLFDRLRASTATLAKGTTKAGSLAPGRILLSLRSTGHIPLASKYPQQDLLYEALAFVVWYVRFLEWELRSTASYQRRITALQSLMIVLRSGLDPGVAHSHLSKSAQGQLSWAHGLQIASPRLIRVLSDLIMDPFDDIRNTAVSVLELCLSALPAAERNLTLVAMRQFLHRAENTVLRTGRADQADGVARAYSLLFSLLDEDIKPLEPIALTSNFAVFHDLTEALKATLLAAHEDLTGAVSGRPVHNTFAALRYKRQSYGSCC